MSNKEYFLYMDKWLEKKRKELLTQAPKDDTIKKKKRGKRHEKHEKRSKECV